MLSRLSTKRLRKSELVMLPVATTRSRRGDRRSKWLSRKSLSFVTRTPPSSLSGEGRGLCRGCGFLGPLGGVDCFVPRCGELPSQRQRKLGIDNELHAAPGAPHGAGQKPTRRTRARRAGRHVRDRDGPRQPRRCSSPMPAAPTGSRPGSATRAPSAGRGRWQGRW